MLAGLRKIRHSSDVGGGALRRILKMRGTRRGSKPRETMHPEILRELTAQRGREMRARAHQARLARMASWAGRAGRRGHGLPDEADGFVVPAIPDYVDGSFRTELADDQTAAEAGHAPARHAVWGDHDRPLPRQGVRQFFEGD
jgi:hypothetical protein